MLTHTTQNWFEFGAPAYTLHFCPHFCIIHLPPRTPLFPTRRSSDLGNVSSPDLFTITTDYTAPVVDPLDLLAVYDTGASQTDNITNAQDITFTGRSHV